MVRVSFLFFGYRIFKIEESAKKIPTLLLAKKITFYSTDPYTFIIAERNYKETEKLLKNKAKYTVSECRGLGGAVRRIKYKRGLTVGIIISVLLSIFLTNIVWEVNVEGNSSMTDTEISFALSECGFNVGDIWPFVDKSEVEKEFLARNDGISWININRRGSVAYVVVSEKTEIKNDEEKTAPTGYANIVATVGCVIEEITVKRGQAEVKAGDVVKAGDILISGVLPDTSGGGFCYAEGTVIGRLYDRIEAEVSREYEKIVKTTRKPIESTLKIFNLEINIFKKYRNSYDSCDIIEDVKVFSLFGKRSLPFSISTKHVTESKKESSLYTDEELIRLASSTLSSKTANRLLASDLLRIRTDGEFTDTGYKMYSDIVFLSNIGETREFTAN